MMELFHHQDKSIRLRVERAPRFGTDTYKRVVLPLPTFLCSYNSEDSLVFSHFCRCDCRVTTARSQRELVFEFEYSDAHNVVRTLIAESQF